MCTLAGIEVLGYSIMLVTSMTYAKLKARYILAQPKSSEKDRYFKGIVGQFFCIILKLGLS